MADFILLATWLATTAGGGTDTIIISSGLVTIGNHHEELI
jgi:hypothetical protein